MPTDLATMNLADLESRIVGLPGSVPGRLEVEQVLSTARSQGDRTLLKIALLGLAAVRPPTGAEKLPNA